MGAVYVKTKVSAFANFEVGRLIKKEKRVGAIPTYKVYRLYDMVSIYSYNSMLFHAVVSS